MVDEHQIDQLLDEWEDLRESAPQLSLENFVQSRLRGADAVLIAQFRRKAQDLAVIDRRMERLAGAPPTAEPAAGPPPTADKAAVLSSTLRATPQDKNAGEGLVLSELRSGLEPIPGYVLVSRLGVGGFGEVWRADAPGGFHVALKFVQFGGHVGEVKARALEVIKDVHHPHLLSVFGTWRIGHLLVIATELADRTLLDRLQEAQREGLQGIPKEELLEYFVEAAKGIDALNDPGESGRMRIQHRDIKPQNLLLSGGSVKVGDFGLARSVQHDLTGHTGSLTLAYAAPECFDGKTSNRGDQYSLAITYCHLRGGRLPFEGTQVEVMEGHRRQPPDLNMLPAEERPSVARALAKSPEDRWNSCSEFLRQLRAAGEHVTFAGNAVQVPNVQELAKSRSSGIGMWAVAAVVLAAVALLLLSIAIRYHTPPGPETSMLPEKAETATSPTPLAVAPFDAEQAKRHQQIWADRLNVPVNLTNSIGMKLALIPAGEFQMGSGKSAQVVLDLAKQYGVGAAKTEHYEDEHPQHQVQLSRPFYLGIHEVTLGQFQAFVEATGYKTQAEADGLGGWSRNWLGPAKWEQKREYTWQHPGFSQSADHPVVQVSWNDAAAFCKWLTGNEKVEYRLPTEAEWEFACRAGTTSLYHTGENPRGLLGFANVADSGAGRFPPSACLLDDDGYEFTAPVGHYRPNAFGLHDMHGNVVEWCEDWYDAKYYASSSEVDPRGPSTGQYRVCRGANWYVEPFLARSAKRNKNLPHYRNFLLGFRVVRNACGEG